MQVLLVSAFYPPVLGGAELQAQSLARELDSLGVRVSILTRPYKGEDAEDRDGGIQIHRRLSALPVGPLWGLTYMMSTQRWLRRLHRQWDVVHNQQVGLHSWASVRVARALGKSCLLRFSSLGQGGDLAVLQGHRFGHHLVKELRGARRFVALTRAGAEEIVRYQLPADRIRGIPNGVDLLRFPAQSWPDVARSDALRMLFVGRLSREKGLDVLLEALRQVKCRVSVSLRIVGSGPELGSLRAQTVAAGLDPMVEFCGPQHEVIAHYAWSEVVVLPSHFEGMPNVVLEAMACARPVLGTRIDGTADLIAEGSGGWLVPSRDPVALAQRVEQIANERVSLASIGLVGRRIAETKYSIARVASMYLCEYEAMLSEGMLGST